jgi:hypothetical protein
MIAHRPNGDCVYLDPNVGCTIHAIKPTMCREMDCRTVAQRVTFTQARKLDKTGRLKLSVWARGKKLLKNGQGNEKNN